MHSIYNVSTPFPTDYFSQIFANLRLIKTLFEERYTLDHYLNDEDLNPTDGHNKVTMKGITVNMLEDRMPYPLNPETGTAQLPANAGIVFNKIVEGNSKLCFATKDKNGTLTEIILR